MRARQGIAPDFQQGPCHRESQPFRQHCAGSSAHCRHLPRPGHVVDCRRSNDRPSRCHRTPVPQRPFPSWEGLAHPARHPSIAARLAAGIAGFEVSRCHRTASTRLPFVKPWRGKTSCRERRIVLISAIVIETPRQRQFQFRSPFPDCRRGGLRSFQAFALTWQNTAKATFPQVIV